MREYRVLLVEDDDNDAYWTSKSLKEKKFGASFLIHRVSSVDEAKKAFQEVPSDLVLLDLGLSDSQGLDGFDSLRELAPQLDIIILTGTEDEELAFEAVKRGASDFLVKGKIDHAALYKAVLFSQFRRDLESKLRKSEKLAAVGRLAAGIAHDFNNQLTVLRLQTDEMRNATKNLGGKSNRILSDQEVVLDRCRLLANQILAFTGQQPVRLRSLNLQDYLPRMDKVLQRMLGETLILKTEVDPEAYSIAVDHSHFDQIIWNLISYSRERLSDSQGKILVRARNEKDRVLIEVSDNGPQPDREDLKQIFEPFYTSHKKLGTSGIGLSLVYSLATQFKGEVRALANLGTEPGMRFLISFPKSDLPVVIGPARTELPAREFGVLLVDDEEEILELAKCCLESEGLKVFACRSAHDAQIAFDQFADQISLVITDMSMPGMSGKDLLTYLRGKHPQLPVILMSGYASQGVKDENELALRYLPKPFTMDDLLQCTKQELAKI